MTKRLREDPSQDAPGDTSELRDLFGLLEHPSPHVRDAALSTLGDLAQRGHAESCQAVSKLLQHKSWSVRAQAACVLGRIASVGDLVMANLLAACLEDSNAGVRAQAPVAFSHLTDGSRGNVGVVRIVHDRLSHPSAAVRQAAVATMGCIANDDSVSAIAALLADDAQLVREKALLALEHVVPVGNARVAAVISPIALHCNPAVRCTALTALRQLAPRGDHDSGKLAENLLQDPSPLVREQAAAAIACLAVPDDSSTLHMLASELEDPAERVRRAAVAALISMAQAAGNTSTVLKVVQQRCEHPSQIVRRMATAACGRLSALTHALPEAPSKSEVKREVPAKQELSPPAQVQTCNSGCSTDFVSQGLQEFLGSMSGKEDLCEADATGQDFVGRGLAQFLADARRRPGPVCALKVEVIEDNGEVTTPPFLVAATSDRHPPRKRTN